MNTSKRVMIVEDDPLLSIVEEKLITKLGYDVVGKAASGEDMLDNFNKFKPEILVMDMQLSGLLNGIQSVRKLRESQIDIPVIFLSGDNDPKVVNQAKEVNFIDFLLKPVTAFTLSEPLEKAANQLTAKAQYAA
ncbi:MAG: response regulator [Balneolaceae bacterium]